MLCRGVYECKLPEIEIIYTLKMLILKPTQNYKFDAI